MFWWQIQFFVIYFSVQNIIIHHIFSYFYSSQQVEIGSFFQARAGRVKFGPVLGAKASKLSNLNRDELPVILGTGDFYEHVNTLSSLWRVLTRHRTVKCYTRLDFPATIGLKPSAHAKIGLGVELRLKILGSGTNLESQPNCTSVT